MVFLTLRLKAAGKKIAEIETLGMHNQKEGALFKPLAFQAVDKNIESAPGKSQVAAREASAVRSMPWKRS